MLQCISDGKKDQHVHVEVNEDALTFIVAGRSKFTQAQTNLKRSLFQKYEVAQGSGRGGEWKGCENKFSINLSTLLDCLQILGPATLAHTSVSLSYRPQEAVFRVTLEENGVFTSCEIRALVETEADDDAGGGVSHARVPLPLP